MPNPNGNPGNSGGKKGRSGRRSFDDEKTKALVVNKAWEILQKAFDNPKVTPLEKRKIALEIAKRTIPQEVKGNLGGSFTITWQEK